MPGKVRQPDWGIQERVRMGMARALLLRGSESRFLSQTLPHRPFVRRAVRRFMPGEELSDALEAARRLDQLDRPSIFTVLGENVESAAETRAVAAAYSEALNAIQERKLDTDLSVKPTHLGLDLDPALALENLARLATLAGGMERLVALDMEASGYVDATLELYRALRSSHANVGICLQAYLRRTEEDLDGLLASGPMIRLVKGAYNEAESVAFPRKAEVDANYLRLARRMLEARREDPGVRVAFGTHDARMISTITRLADELGLPPDACEFQMLYGIGRDLQAKLVTSGRAVRVLVSYGSHWFPWYMRRLAERPANVGFVLRSMVRR
ncbi:MAG: proline dehydrogenase family protein [marine benthic group bacterium]|nr:proline dehydrogenase family protein [Gemmatimonadota bacterium]